MTILSRLRTELWEDRLNEKRPASAWVRQLFTAAVLPAILVYEAARFIMEPMHLAFLWCTALFIGIFVYVMFPCEVTNLFLDRIPCHLRDEYLFKPVEAR